MSVNPFTDEFFMKEAIKEAFSALEKDEVPIGCVIVCENQIISRAHNFVETLKDVTAHAEMQAITSASSFLGGKYLNDCTMYVTLEPCVMWAGAIYWSRLKRLVFGASDNKKGFSSVEKKVIHSKTSIVKGVMSEECGKLLVDFFNNKR